MPNTPQNVYKDLPNSSFLSHCFSLMPDLSQLVGDVVAWSPQRTSYHLHHHPSNTSSNIHIGVGDSDLSVLEFQMFFSFKNPALALLVVGLTSVSVPPCLLMTEVREGSARITASVLASFILMTLVLPLWMLNPTCPETAASVLILSCICC